MSRGGSSAVAASPVEQARGPATERVLVVDDEPAVRLLISRLLEDAGVPHTCASGVSEAIDVLAGGEEIALALCDMTMPGESGLDLVRHVRAAYPDIAIVMVTGVDDPEIARAAIELGAFGYVVKPFKPNALRIAVDNACHRRRLEIENRLHREHLSELVAERTAELRAAVKRLEASDRALRSSREETIRRLALAVELRDGETGEHIERMSRTCARVAAALGLPPDRCELIRLASPLHDVGKIGIPDRILTSPNALSTEDWEVVRRHPEIGHRMLAGSGGELLDLAASIALTHHERLDGSGYPRGLRGDAIPIEGRIAAVADAFDTLTSGRVYQPALPVDQALEILAANRGTHFDPDVVDAFLQVVAEDDWLADGSSRTLRDAHPEELGE